MKIFAEAYKCGKEASIDELKRLLSAANPGSIVQVVKLGATNNELLVEMLAAQTLQAESSGSLLAKKPEIDFLLRVAGTTQISKAIRALGVKAGAPFVLVVASRSALRGTRPMKRSELPRRELTAAELWKIEKAALLNAARA